MAETRPKPKSTPANGARTRTADLHDRVTRLETRFDSEVRYLATKEDIARSEEKIVRIEKDMASKQDLAELRQDNAAMETRIIKWIAGFGFVIITVNIAIKALS